jgi:hypothetical protein
MTTSLTSDIPPAVAIFEPMVKTGSVSEAQLAYIEALSHGFGENIAEARYGRSLLQLSAAEASVLIDYLIEIR